MAEFEERIAQGRLLPGERIPPTLELAESFGVGRNAVQQALSILAERGLVERRSRKGTFISPRLRTENVALLFTENIVANPNMHFLRQIYQELLVECRRKGWNGVLYCPTVPGELKTLLARLERDIQAGAIKGVIEGLGNEDSKRWLRESCAAPCIINEMDTFQYPEIRESIPYRGITYLLRQGYSRIGVIGTHYHPRLHNFAVSAIRQAFHERSLHFDGPIIQGACDAEELGMLALEQVLAHQPRPAALLVLNDIGCKGVIFSLMQQGIRIPEDMAIFAATNHGMPVLCPVPLTRLEIDAGDLADDLLLQFQHRLNGTTYQPARIRPNLIVGRSCGESQGTF